MTNPIDDEELYEGIYLANLRSPGRVTLSGHDRKVNWDVKEGTGQNGATMTKKGEKPCEFTATFYLVKDDAQGIDDFADWPAFQALIETTVSGKKPIALDIYHPDLASNGIKSVVKGQMGGVVHDGKGGQTIAVLFTEYRPPKAAGGSPSGSKAKAVVDPNAEALAELERLTKQYEKTPWG